MRRTIICEDDGGNVLVLDLERKGKFRTRVGPAVSYQKGFAYPKLHIDGLARVDNNDDVGTVESNSVD